MNHAMEETLRDAQLAFLGRVLSAFTHELKNHLAIINESSGLMGDLLELGRLKDEETSKKFQNIIASIAERIDVANTLAKHLNSFGHRMDHPTAVFCPNDALQEQAALLNKFARLKGVDIILDLQMDLPSVQSNPALLQFLVYVLFTAFLSNAQKGDTIKFSTAIENNGVTIRLAELKINPGATAAESEPFTNDLVAYVAEKLHVTVTGERQNTGWICQLVLPAA